ncbi:MAG: bifunctional adenosylcobinamide kinase/adenosylcobinamide-phosphate guanylyltransferase [Crocinitomicaceae bacterium]|nr:bifunctional adenosylcobinamide kinase/adenosylcobinamide-phosphate guanylyltransferase [Crocinitomicaceae bacterium]
MNKAKVHLITGGQRSGKSEYGEDLTLSVTKSPIYLATSKRWDDEFSERIKVHQQRRTEVWETIEEELYISEKIPEGRVVLLDCITLWLNNVMDHFQFDYDKSYAFAELEWKRLIQKDATVFVITNEIGLGVIPFEKSTRRFVDLQGKVNQIVAQDANEVTLMISGLPLSVK